MIWEEKLGVFFLEFWNLPAAACVVQCGGQEEDGDGESPQAEPQRGPMHRCTGRGEGRGRHAVGGGGLGGGTAGRGWSARDGIAMGICKHFMRNV